MNRYVNFSEYRPRESDRTLSKTLQKGMNKNELKSEQKVNEMIYKKKQLFDEVRKIKDAL